MILLVGRRRNRVHRSRMIVDLILRYHRSGRILGYHEAGADSAVFCQERRQAFRQGRIYQPFYPSLRHVGKFRYGYLEKVKSKRHRLAVEISSAYDLILIGKYDRIICHCVYFSGYHLISISYGVSGGAVYLRRASQRIRVLYLMLLQRQSIAGPF